MDLAVKLQIKAGARLAVVALPDDVALDLPDTIARVDDPAAADAVVVFVRDAAGVDAVAGPAVAAATDDRLAWVCYPKAGKLGTDLNRDSLAALMIARGTRPVRQVSVDDVWSALRFRPGA
ncbi:MAG: hypothetical protein FWF90_00370 [Promicromonosporaceae bacterium]|nr:hypothetical protein [Promicromonosporaceae bacterium]